MFGILDEDELCEWLTSSYGFKSLIRCQLLRSYTNDVYQVDTVHRPYVFKIYGKGWRTETEIRYEVSLLQHLAARGMQIALPIAADTGAVIQKVPYHGAMRHGVLFEYAPGEKPSPPFTPSLYFSFGQAIARMHTLSDDFATNHSRKRLDIKTLIDEPLELANPLFATPEDRKFVTGLAERVKTGIAALDAQGLDWGPIHGDASLDNLHVTPEGDIALYDFDSGGPGWRAADLQGWAIGSVEYREKADAFQRGYSHIRPLRALDLRAAPFLTIAWDIWGLDIDLRNRILKRGPETTQKYLAEQIALLRTREQNLSLS